MRVLEIILDIQLSDDLQIFSLTLWAVISLSWWCQVKYKSYNFAEVKFIFFFFCCLCFCYHFETIAYSKVMKIYTDVFF